MGVTIDSISPGDGKNYPKPGDTVTIHYHGTLLSGAKFDSSYDRKSPFQVRETCGLCIVFVSAKLEIFWQTKIGVGQVIKAWVRSQ